MDEGAITFMMSQKAKWILLLSSCLCQAVLTKGVSRIFPKKTGEVKMRSGFVLLERVACSKKVKLLVVIERSESDRSWVNCSGVMWMYFA